VDGAENVGVLVQLAHRRLTAAAGDEQVARAEPFVARLLYLTSFRAYGRWPATCCRDLVASDYEC
jgi:hypothetical protein